MIVIKVVYRANTNCHYVSSLVNKILPLYYSAINQRLHLRNNVSCDFFICPINVGIFAQQSPQSVSNSAVCFAKCKHNIHN